MSVEESRHAPRVLGAAVVACLPLVICLAALGAWSSPASADRDSAKGVRAPAVDVALWREECGACHVAYPARLLPAADWQRLMGGLDEHFGTDASLDPASARRIESLLVGGAGGASRASGRPASAAPRITTTLWFVREHDEVPSRAWRDPKVGSAARCESCHVDAAAGRFDEERIRWPFGR